MAKLKDAVDPGSKVQLDFELGALTNQHRDKVYQSEVAAKQKFTSYVHEAYSVSKPNLAFAQSRSSLSSDKPMN